MKDAETKSIKPKSKSYLVGFTLLAILIATGLYADKMYTPPEPPPQIIQTIKGPVVLYDDANPGDLITAPNLGTIFYLNNQKKRIVFPDEQTFLSWYGSFDGIKTIPLDVLQAYPLAGKNATIRAGTYLVTIPSSNQVWMISYPNQLHWLEGGEELVKIMFGENWKDRVVDLPEYYFVNYEDSYSLKDENTYLPGLLISVPSRDEFYMITNTGQRLVTKNGLIANHWQEKFAIIRDEPVNLEINSPPIDDFDLTLSSPDMEEQYYTNEERIQSENHEIIVGEKEPEMG